MKNDNKVYIQIPLSNELEDLALDLESIACQLSFLSKTTEQESENMVNLADDELLKFIRGKTELLTTLESKLLSAKDELFSIVERERKNDDKDLEKDLHEINNELSKLYLSVPTNEEKAEYDEKKERLLKQQETILNSINEEKERESLS